MADLDKKALEAAAKVKALRNYPEDHILHRSGWAALFGPEHVPEVAEIVSAYLSALSPVVAAPAEADGWRWWHVDHPDYVLVGSERPPFKAHWVIQPLYSADRIDTLEREKRLLAGKLSMAERDLATLTAERDAAVTAAILAKPLYSRRQMETRIAELSEAVELLVGCVNAGYAPGNPTSDHALSVAARTLSKSEPVKG